MSKRKHNTVVYSARQLGDLDIFSLIIKCAPWPSLSIFMRDHNPRINEPSHSFKESQTAYPGFLQKEYDHCRGIGSAFFSLNESIGKTSTYFLF